MKAFASDFDGTLYFMWEKEKFKKEDIEQIQSFQKEGHLFGVCTGRSLSGIINPIKNKMQFDFYILASGAVILDKSFQVIYETVIKKDIVKDIYERYKDVVESVIHANDTVYTFVGNYPHQVLIQSIDDIEGDHIYGLSFGTESEEEATKISQEINHIYGHELKAFVNKENIDIVSKNCSKGHALQILKEKWDINHMSAMGDSYNDIPMLIQADTSFTFSNSPKEVQDKVNYIVSGVAEALQIIM